MAAEYVAFFFFFFFFKAKEEQEDEEGDDDASRLQLLFSVHRFIRLTIQPVTRILWKPESART